MEQLWRWVQRHPDPAAAIGLVLVSIGCLWAHGTLSHPSALPGSAALIGFAALVAGRRRYPVAVAILASILVAVPQFTPGSSQVETGPLIVAALAAVFLYAFALGSDCPWLRSTPGVAALIVGLSLTSPGFNPLVEMMTIGPWLAGMVLASRRSSVQRLEVRTRELEAERELFAAASVRYERTRIARELHDIVAHCVSLIVVQANAGEHLAHQDPGSAAEAFESISEAARQAETEIDRLVELLDTSAPAAAPAGLRIVAELVERVQASGLRITATFSGDSDSLCEQSAETAYRVVQEAVTNAMKHAPGAPIHIKVRGHSAAVEVEVVNRSAAWSRSGLENLGGGHGLGGMRERVARCGGTLDAGPTPDHGWHVLAWLPRYPHDDAVAGAGRRRPINEPAS